MEWCVSALVRIFKDKRFEKIHKLSTGPSNSRSGVPKFVPFRFFFVKSSYIRDIITASLRYKNTKRKTRSAVPEIGVHGTLRVVFNFSVVGLIIAVKSS